MTILQNGPFSLPTRDRINTAESGSINQRGTNRGFGIVDSLDLLRR